MLKSLRRAATAAGVPYDQVDKKQRNWAKEIFSTRPRTLIGQASTRLRSPDHLTTSMVICIYCIAIICNGMVETGLRQILSSLDLVRNLFFAMLPNNRGFVQLLLCQAVWMGLNACGHPSPICRSGSSLPTSAMRITWLGSHGLRFDKQRDTQCLLWVALDQRATARNSPVRTNPALRRGADLWRADVRSGGKPLPNLFPEVHDARLLRDKSN